ncbi:MAG: hypothetical protein L0Y72_02620 [Gemmataceae bacterium]|nr:hypothetical protein [Gemmataceae bacterium]MCI0737911.1 hypothetical protein [Gemmataceae bacterium]
MVRQPVRFVLLLGAIVATTVSTARAEDCARPCGPKTRTITITECVPEQYKAKRTAYRVECKQEEYEAVRTVMVPEVQERVVTHRVHKPVMKTETRKVCKTVTECEERVVMQKCWKTVQETCVKKKLVRLGHWECKEECVPDCCAILRNCFHRCCDSCDHSNCGRRPETRTVTRRCWVHCPEYRDCPTTVCKRVCVETPVKVKVPVTKQVWSEVQVQVCQQFQEEKRVEKVTVCVPKQEKYKAVRTVRVCVPYETEVTMTRMVQRTREIQVADTAGHGAGCGDGCGRRCGLFDRLCGRGGCCR